jgi:hypothetical protein
MNLRFTGFLRRESVSMFPLSIGPKAGSLPPSIGSKGYIYRNTTTQKLKGNGTNQPEAEVQLSPLAKTASHHPSPPRHLLALISRSRRRNSQTVFDSRRPPKILQRS